MTAYLLERAWVADGVPRRRPRRGRGRPLHLGDARTPTRCARFRCAASSSRASPTPTAMPSTAPCAAAPSANVGTFWTWRDQMYAVAARLDPDTYLALARATYREMAAAGITCVGEFHYLHHRPDGTTYADPNEMGHVLVEAARQAGIRTHPARHALPLQRFRGSARGSAAALQRRLGGGLGGAGRRSRDRPWAALDQRAARRHRCGRPLRPRRAGCRPRRGGRRVGRPALPRPPLRAGRRERRPASRRTASRPPGCSPTTACWDRRPRSSTPPT